jgi:uncharacterized protein YdeI (YjbR/CyaY-like superfamily)
MGIAMPAESHKGLPVLEFADRPAWERWLADNHAGVAGVFLKLGKRGSPRPALRHAEALEVALCFGWIDGQSAPYDEHHWLVRFTPRRARSKWSQVNRQKALELIERGAMRPSGLAEVQRAQQDGRWEAAYEPQSRATVPDDFRDALRREPHAEAFFETLTGQNRYAFLYRIADAKRPETRARRIEQFVAMLAEGRTLH